tara:strand:- start:231 stop:410 length:180 start_codon:yes stop_codon:yes gene_type:complete
MSYFEKLFKKQVKDAIKEMVENNEIFIDGSDIFIHDGKISDETLRPNIELVSKKKGDNI